MAQNPPVDAGVEVDANLPAPVYGAPPMRDAAVEPDAQADAEPDAMGEDPPPQPLYGAVPPDREDEPS